MVVAVAAALGGLEVIALRSLDAAEARASAHDVENHGRKPCTGHVGNTLLLEGNTGAGGRGDDAFTGCGGAVHHVDGCNFTLCLQEASSYFGQTGGHIFRDLGLRGDRITEEETCACTDGSFRNGFAAFHKC